MMLIFVNILQVCFLFNKPWVCFLIILKTCFFMRSKYVLWYILKYVSFLKSTFSKSVAFNLLVCFNWQSLKKTLRALKCQMLCWSPGAKPGPLNWQLARRTSLQCSLSYLPHSRQSASVESWLVRLVISSIISSLSPSIRFFVCAGHTEKWPTFWRLFAAWCYIRVIVHLVPTVQLASR